MTHPSRLHISMQAAFIALPFLVVPAIALARAGGGQGYGGGGGGGDFGGDGGDGRWGWWPLLFLGHGSWGGLIALFIVLYVFRQMRRRSEERRVGNGGRSGCWW